MDQFCFASSGCGREGCSFGTASGSPAKQQHTTALRMTMRIAQLSVQRVQPNSWIHIYPESGLVMLGREQTCVVFAVSSDLSSPLKRQNQLSHVVQDAVNNTVSDADQIRVPWTVTSYYATASTSRSQSGLDYL